MKPVRIVIFAKAPEPGFAKTRLIPVLGAQGAAHLARHMLAQTLRKALAANLGPVELCVTPAGAGAIWRTFAIPDALQWSDQGDGDLGQRMARAARRALEIGESVLLIGTDCPELDAAHLRQAAGALQRADAALIPAADGGYVLLGLNRFDASLFADIAWSTESVAVETQRRLAHLGWTVQNHAMLHDVDVPADLERVPAAWLQTTHSVGCASRTN